LIAMINEAQQFRWLWNQQFRWLWKMATGATF
jgi:hypothetical protein